MVRRLNEASLDLSKNVRPPLQLHSWLANLKLYDVWHCYYASEKDFTFYPFP